MAAVVLTNTGGFAHTLFFRAQRERGVQELEQVCCVLKSEEMQWSHHLHTHSLSQPPTVVLLQRLDGQITATREKSESEAKAQLQTLSQELKSDVAQLHTRVEGTAQEVRTCVSISLSLSPSK